MIDLHCHVLPGIDDGPESIEGSIALARAAANAGMQTLVATPHVSRRYPNDSDTILELVNELNGRIAGEELALEVLPGAEVAVSKLPDLSTSELARLCLGGGEWLLLECPLGVNGPPLGPAVARLQQAGFRILLAHPERAPAFHKDPSGLRSLVDAGALTSVTAGAFVGQFGSRVRKFALELVGAGMVHSVASDAHDRSRRPPGLASELERAGLGGLADWLTFEVPQAVLSGADIPPRPAAAPAARRGTWWRRRGTKQLPPERASWLRPSH